MPTTEKYQNEFVPKSLTLVGPYGSDSVSFEPYIRRAFEDLKKRHPEFSELNTEFFYNPMQRKHKGFVYFQTEAAANLFRGLTPEGTIRVGKVPDSNWIVDQEKLKELKRLKAQLPLVKANPDLYADPEQSNDWSYDVVLDYESRIKDLEAATKAPLVEVTLEPFLTIPQLIYRGEKFDFEVQNLFFSGLILDDDDYPNTLITNFRVNGTRDPAHVELSEIKEWLSFLAPEDRPQIYFNSVGCNAILHWSDDPRGAVKYKAILGLYHFSNNRVALSMISKKLPPSPKTSPQRKSPSASPARRRAHGGPRRTPTQERPHQELSLRNSFGALSC
jgi:hypothetical protein